MAKVTVYKNSKLATVFSFLGYLVILIGFYCAFNDEIAIGVVLVIAGILLKVLASFISEKKKAKDAKQNQAL